MLNPTTWHRQTGTYEVPLPPRAHVRLRLSGETDFEISAVDINGTETVLQNVTPKNAFSVPKWSDVLDGYVSLHVKPSGKKAYGISCQVTERQTSEPLNDELPPDPEPKSNLLAKMREEFRRSLGDTRERFENDTLFPGYEIDDDEPDFQPIERDNGPPPTGTTDANESQASETPVDAPSSEITPSDSGAPTS